MGGLLVLTVYHFLLFFQNSDKSYLFYSLYTFLLFVRQSLFPDNMFLQQWEPLATILDDLRYFSSNIEWAYNTIYFVFAFTFVNLKSYAPKWYQFVFWGVALLFALNMATELIHIINGNTRFAVEVHLFMSGILTVFAAICYIPLLKAPSNLKYYIVFGSAAFLIFSLLALLQSLTHFIDPMFGNEMYVSIFYIGLIFENMLFSLGLGHKQRLILNEKQKGDKELIQQLQENEKLRDVIQQRLEEDVKNLNRTVELERMLAKQTTLEKELAEMKLASLRSQMNPHFIFNALNSIKCFMIDDEQEKAVYYLNKFSKLVRLILSSSMEKHISLKEELEIAEHYVQIERIRFNDSFNFELKVDAGVPLNTIKVPALILQPFLENAIWHGLSPKTGHKELKIIVGLMDDILKITITDNGIGREKSLEIRSRKLLNRKSYGLKLTEERLQIFDPGNTSGSEFEFFDLKNADGEAIGTKVVVRLAINSNSSAAVE